MLFLREMKKTIFNVSYVLFVVVLIVALNSQEALDFSGSKMIRPKEGESYGVTHKEIPEIIMPKALEKLWSEFCENNYRTYPIGLIKHVKLNHNEQGQIAKILSDITGMDKAAVMEAQAECSDGDEEGLAFHVGEDMVMNDNGEFVFSRPDNETNHSPEEKNFRLTVRDDMDYSEFKALMQRVDDILGGGSDYDAESLIGFRAVPLSYEEALRSYELAVKSDRITGGYARLFSDYAGAMVMCVFPVFLAVIMCMKDRRARVEELVYTKGISAARVILSRYLAVIAAAMLPVMILSYISNATVWGMYGEARLDYLAPLKYDIGWIMPGAMMAVALGMCLTELTNTPIAAAVQGFWWLVDLNMGMRSVAASYSLFRLAPRHNAGESSYFRTQDFTDNYNRLAANRLLFVLLSLLVVAMTIIIYECKRKGKLNGNYKIRRAISGLGNRKNKF